MEAVVKIVDVERTRTKDGNTRFTVRDGESRESIHPIENSP